MTTDDTAIKKAPPTPAAAEVEIVFVEADDGSVTATFPVMNGSRPFEITLQNLTWSLMEDVEKIQAKDTPELKDMLDFFRGYVVGGPSAVPLKQTMAVFQAIVGYVNHSMTSKN
jgi:hypothetical protein